MRITVVAMSNSEKFYIGQADCICNDYFESRKKQRQEEIERASKQLRLGRRADCPEEEDEPLCPLYIRRND